MPCTGTYGDSVFESFRWISRRAFDYLIKGSGVDLDPWTYYNLPVLGIDALSAAERAAETLGSCRIELPTF